MKASVLIPSYRSAMTIRACLASVLSQDFDGAYEVILADSGDDGTAEIARHEFPAVRVLHSGSRLDAEQARNWAASEARGSVFAFIDSDCVADRDWLRRMCAALDDRSCDGVGGAIRPVDGENDVCWAGYFCEFREFLPGSVPRNATYLTPNNAAYRRAIFERAGGFPVGYFPLEDQVFYTRLAEAGARIRFDPSIVVRHNHRRQVRPFLKHQARIGRADALLARDIGSRGTPIATRPWLAVLLLFPLATYRFVRTIAACWREDLYRAFRRPFVTVLCWLGMWGWGIGFVAESFNTTRHAQER